MIEEGPDFDERVDILFKKMDANQNGELSSGREVYAKMKILRNAAAGDNRDGQ